MTSFYAQVNKRLYELGFLFIELELLFSHGNLVKTELGKSA